MEWVRWGGVGKEKGGSFLFFGNGEGGDVLFSSGGSFNPTQSRWNHSMEQLAESHAIMAP